MANQAPIILGAGSAAANPRKEQLRSVETRLAILGAALADFADQGFERASLRAIAERAGLHHTLVTYHFGTKDALWRATAEHYFGQIDADLPAPTTAAPGGEPIDRVRGYFQSLLAFTAQTPALHHFILREARQPGPRLTWLLESFVAPMMDDIIPDIAAAQAEGDLPAGDPILIYYLLVGVVTTPSALGPEIAHFGKLEGVAITEPFGLLVDQLIFRKKPFRVP